MRTSPARITVPMIRFELILMVYNVTMTRMNFWIFERKQEVLDFLDFPCIYLFYLFIRGGKERVELSMDWYYD